MEIKDDVEVSATTETIPKKRYCSVEESIKDSFEEIKLMREGKIRKSTLDDLWSRIEAWKEGNDNMADNIRWFFNPESEFPIKGEIVDDVPDEFIERKMKEAEERGDLIDEWTVKYDFFAKTIAKEVVTKYPKAKPVNDELNEWLLFNDDGEEFLISRSKTPNFSWTDGAERFKKATCNQIYYATNDIKFAYEIVGKYIKVLYDRVRTLILTRLINK